MYRNGGEFTGISEVGPRGLRDFISWTDHHMRPCCIYAVRMPAAPAVPATSSVKTSLKRPPAADRVYTHVKDAVLDRRYQGGTLLTEGDRSAR